jgi:hypothetical protein
MGAQSVEGKAMVIRLKHLALIVVAASLSGCGSFFDDLNAAAAYNAQWAASQPQPAPDTDYVQACQTYGCPSNQPAQNPNSGNTRPSGCATPFPDGSYGGNGGTACPQ